MPSMTSVSSSSSTPRSNHSGAAAAADKTNDDKCLLMTLVEAASNALDEETKNSHEGDPTSTGAPTRTCTSSSVATVISRSETPSPAYLEMMENPYLSAVAFPAATATGSVISPSPPTVPPSASSVQTPVSAVSASPSASSKMSSAAAAAAAAAASSSSSSIYHQSSSSTLFLTRLRKALNDASIMCLHWMPDGHAFQISQPQAFVKILPDLFQLKNRSSFLRKLNGLGFTRVHDKATMNLDIFQHEQFVQGVVPPKLMIARKTTTPIKSTTTVTPSLSAVAVKKQQQEHLSSSAKRPLPRLVSTCAVIIEEPVVAAAVTAPPLPPLSQQRSRHSNNMAVPPQKVDLPPRLQNYPGAGAAAAAAAGASSTSSLFLHHVDYSGSRGSVSTSKAPTIVPSTTTPPTWSDDQLLIQSLLRERESLLHDMDRMSFALSTLLSQKQQQQGNAAAAGDYNTGRP